MKALLTALLFPAALLAQTPLDLRLPTGNDALFRNDGPAFYQYTDRTFEGEKSTPWEGGKYGFTRTPVRTSAGVINRQFHEGIDIRPVKRDASGAPSDEVRAIADGTVVHASEVAGYSNYGKYVVIEHRWDGSPWYSLYAHLNAINVKPGKRVLKGDQIGILGWTGAGIDKPRAHLHLELGMMLSRNFDAWHSKYFGDSPNRHGNFNGMNLSAMDVAELFLAQRKSPISITQFLKTREPAFKVAVPRGRIDILEIYPWLFRGDNPKAGLSWEIAFSGSGLPLSVTTRAAKVTEPTLTWVKPSPYPSEHFTRGYVTGSGPNAHLTASGRRYLDLIVGD